ncbi:MAG: hypothetical protein Q9184_005280 [Pyrenodesmia sp. 2 TL-2023]
MENNVEGIRNLFERRLAAPSDRDDMGCTPLMIAAFAGAFEACQLLLDEGSDPLAISSFGYNSLDSANIGFLQSEKKAAESILEEKVYIKVIKLLLQADSNVIEDCRTTTLPPYFLQNIIDSQREGERGTRSISIDSPYLQRLKQSGFMLDDYNSETKTLGLWVSFVQYSAIRWSSSSIETMLRTVLDLGADICAVDRHGDGPLHGMYVVGRNEASLHNAFEVATALLKNGADPYALNRYGDSVFDRARYFGQTSILLRALERAGYEVNEVQEEIKWRQWCFHTPGHGFAESTAIDGAQIAPPSAEGLILRKGLRGDRLEG